jgi:hypothetical protein
MLVKNNDNYNIMFDGKNIDLHASNITLDDPVYITQFSDKIFVVDKSKIYVFIINDKVCSIRTFTVHFDIKDAFISKDEETKGNFNIYLFREITPGNLKLYSFIIDLENRTIVKKVRVTLENISDYKIMVNHIIISKNDTIIFLDDQFNQLAVNNPHDLPFDKIFFFSKSQENVITIKPQSLHSVITDNNLDKYVTFLKNTNNIHSIDPILPLYHMNIYKFHRQLPNKLYMLIDNDMCLCDFSADAVDVTIVSKIGSQFLILGDKFLHLQNDNNDIQISEFDYDPIENKPTHDCIPLNVEFEELIINTKKFVKITANNNISL